MARRKSSTQKVKSKAKRTKRTSLTKEEIELRTKERIKNNNLKYAMKVSIGLDKELKSMQEEKKKAENLIEDFNNRLKKLQDLKLRIEGAIISLEKVKHDATETES